jgi:hypothetical protein
MNPGDLCICGHTREIHFGAECSIVAGQHTVLGGHFRAGQDCPCKQFVELGLAVEVFQALKELTEICGEVTISPVTAHAVRKLLSAAERAQAVIAQSKIQ